MMCCLSGTHSEQNIIFQVHLVKESYIIHASIDLTKIKLPNYLMRDILK